MYVQLYTFIDTYNKHTDTLITIIATSVYAYTNIKAYKRYVTLAKLI